METHLKNTDLRRRQLAMIHLAKRDLGLDDETYRAALWAVCRVRSAAELDEPARRRLIEHFRQVGWNPKRGMRDHAGKPHNLASGERSPQLKKIEALLTEAARPWAYADGMAKRMYHVERLAFCNPAQLQGVIAALVCDAQRHGRRTK